MLIILANTAAVNLKEKPLLRLMSAICYNDRAGGGGKTPRRLFGSHTERM